MEQGIYIIFYIIILGLLSGALFLIYLPLKYWLKSCGRWTENSARTTNRIFIVIFLIFGCFLYYFKDYRNPSKGRLENAADIKVPPDFKVLKDEYQDMLTDYCIHYDIELKGNAITELVRNIRHSKFYNPNSFHIEVWSQDDLVTVDSVSAVWAKSAQGFDFWREDKRTGYFIKVDTVANTLNYTECAD